MTEVVLISRNRPSHTNSASVLPKSYEPLTGREISDQRPSYPLTYY